MLTILMSLLTAACGNDKEVTEPAAAETAEPAETTARDIDKDAEKTGEDAEEASETAESAEAESGRYADMEGSWKFDDGLFYLTFDADGNWVFTLFSGKEEYAGTIEDDPEDGYMNLMNKADGSVTGKLKWTDEGLMNNDGKYLNKVDQVVLLPSPEYPLNQTANFPGDFANITVNYPEQMSVEARTDLPNSLTFKPIVGNYTRDMYSDILLKFMPMTADYDKFLGQGFEVSKEGMRILLNHCFEKLYGKWLLKSLGTDFVDHGDYLSITGYMLLDGKMFTIDSEEPIRGRMEVRYYGPTGYCLTITTLSYEDRLEDYCKICDNIMNSCNLGSDWSTSPKPVPSQPGTAIAQEEGGYYWLDSDGDKWFWNGKRNIFVTFHKEIVVPKKGKTGAYHSRGNQYSDPPEDSFETLLDIVDAYSEPEDYDTLMTIIDEW
ncbi:MAG: DUF4923 family protein [Lachnospiraceae bacterium]|nr:DUF4923 family protein [Lachnospiraceae bacterium]